MQNKWWLLFKLPTTHPGGRCTCTDSYTHTTAMCTCRRAYVYTDLPTMYVYMHTDAHVYAQTHLHTIQSQTQRHMSVYVCTDPPSHYTKTLRGTHSELLTGNRHTPETSFSFPFGLSTQAPLSPGIGISEDSPATNGKDRATGLRPLHLPEPTALGGPPRLHFDGC